MRTRQIDREFWISNNVAVLSYFERLLFIALWGLADRKGLLLNRADRIKAEAFALDMLTSISDVEAGVEALQRAGLIQILQALDGNVTTCIYIPNFLKYQDIHPHEMKSKLECNYISGQVMECQSQPSKPSLPSQPSMPSQSKNPPTPRKRGKVEGVDEVVTYLNQVTGRTFALDRGNDQIERVLRSGASVQDCRDVIDRCWRLWHDKPEMVANVNKVTPFRKSHFDVYLDEARAGAALTGKNATPPRAKYDAKTAALIADLNAMAEKSRLKWEAENGTRSTGQ